MIRFSGMSAAFQGDHVEGFSEASGCGPRPLGWGKGGKTRLRNWEQCRANYQEALLDKRFAKNDILEARADRKSGKADFFRGKAAEKEGEAELSSKIGDALLRAQEKMPMGQMIAIGVGSAIVIAGTIWGLTKVIKAAKAKPAAAAA